MNRAVLWIKTQPHYRRDAFAAGLEKRGFRIMDKVTDPGPGDVLVSWNMYPSNEATAQYWRQRGAKVLIAENGYIGKDKNGHQLYALARDGHNGSGKWYVGQEDRWTPLGIELAPFRVKDGPIVVRAQRGIGTKLMASPPRWARETVAALQRGMRRPVILRQHPADDRRQALYETDEKVLANCHALVIWASSMGVKALVAGVPVFYAAPHWIMDYAAPRLSRPGEDGAIRLPSWSSWPYVPQRMEALFRLAWAQWSIDELASGEPFRYLLELLP